MSLYLIIFWLPTLVALILVLAARREGEFSPLGLLWVAAWFVTAFVLQAFGHSTVLSATGLVMQVVLAVFLLIRMQVR